MKSPSLFHKVLLAGFYIILAGSIILIACSPGVASVPTKDPAMEKTSVAYTQAMEATIFALPSALPTPSPVVTPNPFSEWKVYVNDYLGYQFSYPPEATIGEEGFNGMDSNEPVPAGMTFEEYFDYLSRTLPRKICVTVSIPTVGVMISPSYETLGKFSSPCGGLGLGTGYRTEGVSETFDIGGKLYPVDGTKFIWEATDVFQFEYFIIRLENGFELHFYGGDGKAGQTYEAYLPYKETMKAILSTLKWVAPIPVAAPTLTCAGIWTHLLPGVNARTSTEYPLRSGPSSGDGVIVTLAPDTPVRVIEGPVCADGLVFWKVEVANSPNSVGWIAEGDGQQYFLIPENE